jgi:cysteine desulfurase family protein
VRRYFDNAATSFPKPPGVVEAVTNYLQDCGAPAGRGAYRAALDVERIVARCRASAATLFGLTDPRRIVFTFNGTDGLNLALLGLCRSGDHVVSTTWEHNSVLRPLRWLQEQRRVTVTLLEPGPQGVLDPAAVRAALRPDTRLVAVQQASNVTGVIQPIADIAAVVRRHGAFFLVDAAQSAGHLPWNLSDVPVDLLACSGHKGLLGPLGTGLLAVGPGVETELTPLRFGGTGTASEDDHQPSTLPDKYESGNLNVPGIVGLDAALSWLLERGVETIRSHEIELTQLLWDGLSSLTGVTLFGANPADVPRTGVISLQLAGFAPHDAAVVLDDHYQIQCRAGLHCAPGVHRSLDTLPAGGTLRLSVGPFTTPDDVAAVVQAVKDLTAAM